MSTKESMSYSYRGLNVQTDIINSIKVMPKQNSFLKSKCNIWLRKKRIKGLVVLGNDIKMIM